jgi:hypothetical protein
MYGNQDSRQGNYYVDNGLPVTNSVAYLNVRDQIQVHVNSSQGLLNLFNDLYNQFNGVVVRILFPVNLGNARIYFAGIELMRLDGPINLQDINDGLARVLDSIAELYPNSADDFTQYLGGVDSDTLLNRPFTIEFTESIHNEAGGCSNSRDCIKEILLNEDTMLEVRDRRSKNNNCFFQAIRFFGSAESTKNCRDTIRNAQGPITIEQAQTLLGRLPITVVKIRNEQLYDCFLRDYIDLQYQKDHMILLHEGHYYAIIKWRSVALDFICSCGNGCEENKCTEEKLKQERRRKLSYERVDLFFDLETHKQLDSFKTTVKRTRDGQTEERFYTHKAIYCFAYVPSMGLEMEFEGLDCIEQFVDFLTKSEKKFRCYSHNGGAFDNYFIFQYLMESDLVLFDVFMRDSVILRGSKILQMEYNEHVFLDTYNHLTRKLDDLGNDFNTSKKKITNFIINGQEITNEMFFTEADDIDVSQYIDFLKRRGWYEAFKEYCKYDCLSLAEIWMKYKSGVSSLILPTLYDNDKQRVNKFKSIVNNAITLPSATMRFWKLSMDDNIYIPEYTSYVFKLCDKAIIGGISHVQQYGYHQNVKCVDVVSLYVWAMMFNIFPEGIPIETDVYMTDKLGIYECSTVYCANEGFCDVPVFKDSRLDWQERNSTNRSLCSIDIDRIRANGGTVIVEKGIYWENTSNRFFNYLEIITNEKQRQDTLKGTALYNEAIRQCAKLFGNGLYGKTMERKRKMVLDIVSSLYDIPKRDFEKCFIYRWKDKYLVRSNSVRENNSPIYLGVFVLAYSRNLMMKFFDAIGRSNVIATETDSIYYNAIHDQKIQPYIGTKIGDLDYDKVGDIKESYFLSKKAYALYNGEKYKYVLKGVPGKVLCWEKYKEWFEKGGVVFDDILFFKRDLFNDATISIGRTTKKIKTNNIVHMEESQEEQAQLDLLS